MQRSRLRRDDDWRELVGRTSKSGHKRFPAELEAMPRNAVVYEDDFYAWTMEQAKLLRSGEFSKIDAQNIADEIESAGRRDRRELCDRLENLIVELLKWRIDPGARCGNWRSQILQQRFELKHLVDDSPSLRQFAADSLAEVYSDARTRIVDELRLLQPDFPADCPFTPEQILAQD